VILVSPPGAVVLARVVPARVVDLAGVAPLTGVAWC
jgi:hypothetical protein